MALCPFCQEAFEDVMQHIQSCPLDPERGTSQCPICMKHFPLDQIGRHASRCVLDAPVAEVAREEEEQKGPPSIKLPGLDAGPKRRILAELRALQKDDTSKYGFSVETWEDDLFCWRVELFGFDSSDPKEKELARGVKDLGNIVLQVKFPRDYPRHPPFIRVITPRFQFRTGHITLGGSVCIEVLTNQGWAVNTTVESVVVSIRANLIEGGARLDYSNREPYGEWEAREAFERMKRTHGWR